MKQYRVIECHPDHLVATLNEYSQAGWEMTTLLPDSYRRLGASYNFCILFEKEVD